jgi:putative flippase GtrA
VTIGSAEVKPAALGTMARFLISGGTGFLLYLGAATLLARFTQLDHGWVALLATVMAIPPTFVLQRSFTFRSSNRGSGQLAGYVGLQLVSALVIAGSAHAGSRLGLPSTVVFVLAGLCGVLVSYVVQAMLIFKD